MGENVVWTILRQSVAVIVVHNTNGGTGNNSEYASTFLDNECNLVSCSKFCNFAVLFIK